MLGAEDVVIVHEKVDPVMLVLVARPGTPLAGKTKVLNHLHLVNGVMKIRCQPREREGLKKYFGRSYQLVEESELKKEPLSNGASKIDPAPFEHEDAEVQSRVPKTQSRPAKKAAAKHSGPSDVEAGDEELLP